jgi:iron complex transport system substrate-binding protein
MNFKWIKPTVLLGAATAILLLGGIRISWSADQGLSLSYARGFHVAEWAGCKLVTVRPAWKDGGVGFRYLLVPQGRTAPSNYPPAQVIYVPVRRVVSLSTTYLAYMDAAGWTDRLVGLGGGKYANTPSVRQRVETDQIKEVGDFTKLNIEILMDLSPDLILTSASGSVYDVHPKLLEAGLPTVLVIDHLEAHPLARLEWIKFLALFFDTLSHAETLFDVTAKRYTDLVQKAMQVSIRPKVITGAPFQGQWWVAKGQSFVAQFIRDAGGDYFWSHLPGVGSLPMDVEAVYEQALEADVWLNTGNWRRTDDALSADPRFAAIKALRQNRVYNNNRRLNYYGGNDYWESGMLNPDIVLADLITIFHHHLLPGHELVYYRQLER